MVDRPQPVPKRKRLSHACTSCRSKKIRCDERQGCCSNCARHGYECITVDPRRPDAVNVERRAAQSRGSRTLAIPPSTPTSLSGRSVAEDQGNASDITLGARGATECQPRPDLMPLLPRFVARPGLAFLSQWLDLAFARLGISEHNHATGSSETELGHMPIAGRRNDSPPRQDLEDLFHKRMSSVVSVSHASQGAHSATIRILKGALTCGLPRGMPTSEALQIAGETVLDIGNLIFHPSSEAVTVLCLLAYLLRGLGAPDKAWQIVALSIAMAQTLGIHCRPMGRHTSSSLEVQSNARIWWTIYILERALCVELERSSIIRDHECNQTEPNDADEVFKAAISLARLQGNITQRLTESRRDEESRGWDLDQLLRQKIKTVTELDAALLQWADNQPTHVRPSQFMYSGSEQQAGVLFLAVQYQQTMLLLHRLALVVSLSHVRQMLDVLDTVPGSRHRIAHGDRIALNAARDLASILIHAEESHSKTMLITMHAPLLAIYVLAVHILKTPTAKTAVTDFQLQATVIDIFVQHRGQGSFSESEQETASRNLEIESVVHLHGRIKERLDQINSDSRKETSTVNTACSSNSRASTQASDSLGLSHFSNCGTAFEDVSQTPFDRDYMGNDSFLDDVILDMDWDSLLRSSSLFLQPIE